MDEIRDINNFIEMSAHNNRTLTPITDTSEENSDDIGERNYWIYTSFCKQFYLLFLN